MSKLESKEAPNSRSGHMSMSSAIALASALSSILVFIVFILVGKPALAKYIRLQFSSHHTTIENYAREAIVQQIMMGDGPEILRKCHMLLQYEELLSVAVKDLSGETVCDIKKPRDAKYSSRWIDVPIYFDARKREVATVIKLEFSNRIEERLNFIVSFSTLFAAALLFGVQNVLTFPLVKRVLRPLAHLSKAVEVSSPEQIELPKLESFRPVVTEVKTIFGSMNEFLKHFSLYEKRLVESTRFKAIAHTAQAIAHDLRAPLGAIERVLLDPESNNSLHRDTALKSLNRLYSMIESFRYAEIESLVRRKQAALDFTSANELLEQKAQQKGIKLETPAQPLPELYIDVAKVDRAWINLVSNALDFAKTLVIVEASLHDSMLIIRVIDDGEGVPQEFIPKLFQRGATFGKLEGTGLGLAYVKQVMRGHGGEVTYRREDNLTIFECRLPNAVQPEKENVVENADCIEAQLVQKMVKSVAICLEPRGLTQSILAKLASCHSGEFSFSEERDGAIIVVSNKDEVMFEVLERDDQEYLGVAHLKCDEEAILKVLKRKFNLDAEGEARV